MHRGVKEYDGKPAKSSPSGACAGFESRIKQFLSDGSPSASVITCSGQLLTPSSVSVCIIYGPNYVLAFVVDVSRR